MAPVREVMDEPLARPRARVDHVGRPAAVGRPAQDVVGFVAEGRLVSVTVKARDVQDDVEAIPKRLGTAIDEALANVERPAGRPRA